MTHSPSGTTGPGEFRWRDVFAAGGEMGARIAAHDWAATPLGPVEKWPQSLRTAVSICLHSRFPILLWWGPELVMLHNDAYLPVLGASKRDALGRPGPAVWPEIWHVIGPMLTGVLGGDGATWNQDQLLELDRYGFVEECYFTFSYSPIIDESGAPGGVFTAVTETTDRVVSDRRLRAVSELAAALVDVVDPEEVARRTVAVLTRSPAVPMARLWLTDPDGPRLAAAAGTRPPPGAESSWPIAEILADGRHRLLPADPADDPQRPGCPMVALEPVTEPGGAEPSAVLVVGLNPRRPVDAGYLSFVALLAGHVGTALAGARAYQEEHRRAEALAELDAAKSAFFANVSHELRTPLTLITGPVRDALDDPAQPLLPAQRRRLELVDRNAARLRRLVDSVLDFTRIEAGRLVPERVAVDVARLTREIAASFVPAVERAGLTFEVDCPRLPRAAYLDRSMWEKVVLNLLSNALKATLSGGIRLRVAGTGGGFRLTVTDTGVGIPADQLPQLFQRFHRVTGPTGRSAEGTGIGLALVRELVQLHDGEVSATSTLGAGATFEVRMPYGTGASRPGRATGTGKPPAAAGLVVATAGPAEGEVGAADGPRILLVDDNADLRAYVTELLAPRFRVRTAADGRAALAVIATDPPDLVLADVMMPLLDGYGLLAAVRADPATAHLPVVLLSARAGPEAAVEGLTAGADDYLVKPFSAGELLARVQANLDRARDRLRRGDWATQLVESITEGVWVADTDGVVIEVDTTFGELTGYGPEGVPYPPPHPWFPDPQTHPEERALIERGLVHLLGEHTGAYEVPFRRPDGRLRWMSVSAGEVPDPPHDRNLLVGTIRDVTDEHLARLRHQRAATLADRLAAAGDEEEVLALTARALGEAFDGTAYLLPEQGPPVARTATGPVEVPTLDSAVAAALTGAAEAPPGPGELPGVAGRLSTATRRWRSWVAFPRPRPVPAEEHLLGGLLVAAGVQALLRLEAVTRQDEATERLRGAVREAGERERAWQAEAAARAAQQRADRRFRTLVEASTAVVWTADRQGRIVEPQPSWEAYTGQVWPEYADDGWAGALHPDDRARIGAAWRDVVAAEAPLFEAEGRLRHAATGGYRHFALRAASLRDESGRVTEWVGTIADTHDRVLAEARDVTARQRALRQAEELARLAGALSSAEETAAIVAVIVATAPAVVGADAVRLALAPPGSPTLEVTDHTGPVRLAVEADVPLARAVRDGAPTPLPDGAGVCLPLSYGDGGVLGALELRWAQPVADDDARRNLLDTVAGLCSQALRRAELTASARAMADFAARLSVTRSTAEAIDVMLSAAPLALGAALPGLAMRDGGLGVRLWYHDHDVPESLAATFDGLRADDPRPIARALRTGQRVTVRDRADFARQFPELPDPVGGHGIVTTVALPLFDGDRRPVAALAFGWHRERPLRAGDLALLDTIADLCEQTLERVRLAAAEHNLVTRLAGRLRSTATQVPEPLEIATRYRPAMTGLHLGGDWYDLIALDGGRLAVVLGDVVGHRVEAAADMAQLRTVVNTLIRSGVPLADVFGRVTELIGYGFLGTCLALIVDPAAGEAAVARVGHPHPVRVPAGGVPETVTTGNSLPLGLVREPVPVTRVRFAPGDLLVLYTDGLVERRGRPYDAGVAALHEVITPLRDEPVEAVADAILTGLSGAEDDQALVVIRHAR
ncbi:SpoIIE family protein phosphatase [Micromonospora sp. PLK6-60]|uniref:SpoIIE family protein phosphatase n=1 Tax=Micromonospora sp. PLK6-60 TaxID=2873383 RepID=UPI001CA60109|nr:SpoIIE family protein phosphatase [Micromonospora sp. PLK6-60]MBY8872696.1 SpoIIE family protein phosphatase [Micromonospora sp. PLK6-60]